MPTTKNGPKRCVDYGLHRRCHSKGGATEVYNIFWVDDAAIRFTSMGKSKGISNTSREAPVCGAP